MPCSPLRRGRGLPLRPAPATMDRLRAGFLVRRRFEVLLGACFLCLAFVGLVWCLMVVLKAVDPRTFHFDLLMDILPWFTPVLIVLALFAPLYWKVAGLLAPPQGGLQRLVEARYRLVVGAFFYLACYTVVVWAAMNLLRIWDVQDFHFNPLVDWIPAILPPWLGWLVGAPLLWKTLGALDRSSAARRPRRPDWLTILALAILGGACLSGGGLVLNQGTYAVTQGLSAPVAQNLTAFGSAIFGLGALAWAGLLLALWRGWRRSEPLPDSTPPLDRLRAARPRLLAQAFVLANLAIGACGLLMAACQAMDPYDFHFYLAKDIWSMGLPLFFGWAIFALGLHLVPALMARRNPARYQEGAGLALGPSGPAAAEASWGYSERDLAGAVGRPGS